jgi:pimeloyl-ACP methyl ester carboxylesterase
MAEDTVELMRRLGIESAVIDVGYSDRGIIGLNMAIHHPERVTRLAVTGANARFDGYTADNQELVSSFDPGSEPVSETYAQLSPDGAEHWPVVLGRLQRMRPAEPSVTNEELRGWLGRCRLRLWRSLRHSREQLLVECGSWFDARRPPTSLVFGLSGGTIRFRAALIPLDPPPPRSDRSPALKSPCGGKTSDTRPLDTEAGKRSTRRVDERRSRW